MSIACIVGHCPVCGAPIYGYRLYQFQDYRKPSASYTCSCNQLLADKLRAEIEEVRIQNGRQLEDIYQRSKDTRYKEPAIDH